MPILMDKSWSSGNVVPMRKVLEYEISEVEPYINWLYFYHAWGLSGKPEEEKLRMRQEALELLHSWEGQFRTYAVFGLFEANSMEDELLVYSPKEKGGTIRISMLRQQHLSTEGQPNLCLADFVRPVRQGLRDHVGAFCASVDASIVEQYGKDEYMVMLAQLLCDRLAEATVERLHEQVRRLYWGYAPDEHLTIKQLLCGEYQGIRPAIGYPSLPDTSVNFVLDQLLSMGEIGIRLTETGMMTPHSSVSGFMFSHPLARYFELGKIGEDQLRDYARRRGIPVEMMRRFLQSSLMKR